MGLCILPFNFPFNFYSGGYPKTEIVPIIERPVFSSVDTSICGYLLKAAGPIL